MTIPFTSVPGYQYRLYDVAQAFVSIFNRNGQLLHTQRSGDPDFDGRYRGMLLTWEWGVNHLKDR